MQNLLQKHNCALTTAVLSVLGLVGKIASVLFKIVLIVLIGTVGIGYYQLTFPLFVFLFSISSVGVSTTITMYIAERGWNVSKSNGSLNFAKKMTLLISIIVSIMLIFFAPQIAKMQGNEEVETIYFSIAFAVVSVSILTLYRAILRGNKLIKEYAISDIIEQISKLSLCIIFASLFMKISVLLSVVGVFVGITLSSLISLVYIMIVLKNYNSLTNNELLNTEMFDRPVFLKNALIAGLSSVLIPFIQFLESVIVIGLLCEKGVSSIEATSLFGLSRGNVSALLNLPNTIILAIEFLLLPDILSLKSKIEISKKSQNIISIALCLGLFVALIFYFFGNEILGFVYGKSLVGENKLIADKLLKIGAISVVFLSIGQVETVVLQGVKKLHLPIVSLGVSSIVKLIFELVFIKNLGIYAVEISNVLFYVTLCFINTVFLIKNKIYFGTPKNILYILLVLLFVESIKIAYGILTNMFGFVVSMLLAVILTGMICGIILFVAIKLKQKKNKLII